jgi:putative ABC transport system permease protein
MAGLKHGMRTLTRTPFVTAVAVLSLALGIGANAAMFSLFQQMLLSSLPVPAPDRLVNLGNPGPKPGSQSCGQAGDCDVVFSHPMFKDLEKAQTTLTGIAAHVLFGANLSYDGETVSGQGELVSGSYFPVLGVRPALGRLLGPDDDKNVGEHAVAVLSYAYWQTHLGADRSALDKTIVVNGRPLTVVGVTARGFEGTTLGGRPDIYVPLTMRGAMIPGWEGFERRTSYWAYLFGRLKPGVSMAQARAELNTLYHGIINDVEAPLQTGMSEQTLTRFRAKTLTLEDGRRGQSSVRGEAKTPLELLFAITAVVLLIACANIANLLLARGVGRGQEMAIRGSIGAGRARLLRQLLGESLLLAALGGAASLLVARWTLGLIGSILPPEAATMVTLKLSPAVVAFAAALSLGTGVLFGLYPALHSTRPDLVTMLKSNAGQPSGARAAARFRSSLVTAQIALSMALLMAAGLFIRSLVNVSRVDLGLSADDVVMFTISPVRNGYEAARSAELFQRVEQELAAIPGVRGVTAGRVPLLGGSNWGTDVAVQGFESGPDIDSNSRYNEVGAGYFATLGMPLVSGRDFTESDVAGAPQVAVVNEAFARKFHLDGASAVGKFMSTGGGGAKDLDIQIVGVARDAKYSEVKQTVPPLFFTPYKQDKDIGQMTFYARAAVDPAQVMHAVQQVVKRLDANLPVEDMKTLDQQARENVFLDRMISTMSGAFAALATLLAAVGLYGVLAYTVAQRTREIGVRMALGAASDRVRRMVLGQVGRMVLVGGVIGVAAALAIGKAAQSLLFGVQGHDLVVMVLVAVLLAAVAFGAGYLPALRASRVDPMKALRYE